MTDVPKVCLVVDYQNIHLMAHQIWAPWGLPVHEALIHPLKFAEQVMAVRSIRQQDPLQQQALLTSVRVFRGAPSNKKSHTSTGSRSGTAGLAEETGPREGR